MERLLQCLIIESLASQPPIVYRITRYPLLDTALDLGESECIRQPHKQCAKNDLMMAKVKTRRKATITIGPILSSVGIMLEAFLNGCMVYYYSPVGFFNVQQSESLLLSYCIKILNGILVCVHIIVASIPFLHYNSHTCVFPYAWSQSQSRRSLVFCRHFVVHIFVVFGFDVPNILFYDGSLHYYCCYFYY